MGKYKKGKVVTGVVTGIETYGIFVKFDEYYSGLIHISEISNKFVNDIYQITEVGNEIVAEILNVDEKRFRLDLSLKNVKKRKNNFSQIKETASGFKTLKKMLPHWVDTNLEN